MTKQMHPSQSSPISLHREEFESKAVAAGPQKGVMTRTLSQMFASLVVMALVPSLLSPVQSLGAEKDDPCRPATTYAYEVASARWGFAFSRACLRKTSLKAIVVILSIRRCDITCGRVRERLTCDVKAGSCKGEVLLEHNSIEVADYTMKFSFWSTGKLVRAGFRTHQATCQSAGVIASCF